MKEKLLYDGFVINSPRETIKQALQANYFLDLDAKIWLKSLDYHNLLSHTYNQNLSLQVIEFILKKFLPSAQKLYERFDEIRSNQSAD